MPRQDIEIQFVQAMDLFLTGQYAAAEIISSDIAACAPLVAETHNLLALIMCNLEKYEDAILQAEAAVRLAPDNIDLKISLGDILLASGDQPKATACYKSVLARNPNHLEAIEKYNQCCNTIVKS